MHNIVAINNKVLIKSLLILTYYSLIIGNISIKFRDVGRAGCQPALPAFLGR